MKAQPALLSNQAGPAPQMRARRRTGVHVAEGLHLSPSTPFTLPKVSTETKEVM